MSTLLDGMIEPTITGFLMKPRRNCQCGLGDRRSRRRWSRRGLFSVRAEEEGMDAPLRGQSKAGALANASGLGKVPERYKRSPAPSSFCEAHDNCDEEVPLRGAAPYSIGVASIARERGVGATALSAAHFLLLYAAMLVAAAGNTALQSVMPAIGREIGIDDFYVAIAYTWSAVLWVLLAPFWAEKSDHHGRKALAMMGVSGFILSMTLCGIVLFCGLHGWIGGALTFGLFAVFRGIYGALGCATPSATQAYLASKTRRSGRVAALSALSSSFGLGTIIGPAVAPVFVVPVLGLAGPLFAFAAIALVVVIAIVRWLPDDKAGRKVGRGAAMSYPSLATTPTGASVVAATAPHRRARLKWNDERIKRWILAGITAVHAQAATLTCLGFFVIDRLNLTPSG